MDLTLDEAITPIDSAPGDSSTEPLTEVGNRPRRVRKNQRDPTRLRHFYAWKKWSWRVTAAWCWSRVFLFLIFGADKLLSFENLTITRFELALTFFGFSPSNKAIFPFLLKAVWLSLICEFSLTQVLFFITVYLFLFPMIAVYQLFRWRSWQLNLRKNWPKPGLAISNANSFNFTNATIALLAAWLLLYGGANGRVPQLVGVILAGFFLVERVAVALSLAGPIEAVRNRWAEAFEKTSINIRGRKATTPFELRWAQFIYRCLLKGAWFTRGSRGRNRAAMLVLFRYLWNLFILGFATVLFWALVIRLNMHHDFIGLGQALMTSSARVLPGVESPTALRLPQWVEAGSSASSWILFVLYAGPAASIFPLIQQAYVTSVSEAHRKFRHAAIELLLHIRRSESNLVKTDQTPTPA